MISLNILRGHMKESIVGVIILVFCLMSCTSTFSDDLDENFSITPSALLVDENLVPTMTPEIMSISELTTLKDVLSIEELITGVEELDRGAYLYKILYLSDGNTVEGYIAAPKDYLEQTKPYPVLIYNRGGNGDYGAVNSNFPPSIAISLNAIIFASQYRETNQGTGKDEFGGDDVHDVTALLNFIEQCTFTDKEHILMWGDSRGSIMTFEILRMDDRIRAAIVTGSVPDLIAVYDLREQEMKNLLKYRIGGTPEDVPEEYAKRSAIQWANEINAPLLIFHTEDDVRAPITSVDEFVTLLESFNKEVTYIRKSEGGHCWRDMAVIQDFFKKHTE